MDALTARRATLSLTIGGHDATSFLQPYVTSFSYTDNATEKADDVQIELQNRDGKWNSEWWPPKGTKVEASLFCRDWFGEGQHGTLRCGSFTVDEVTYDGPPDKLSIKAVSASLSAGLRETTRTKAWEQYTFKDVAAEIAAKNGLELKYTGDPQPFQRIDQREESDLAFLQRLADERGANLKVHDGTLYLFDASLGDAQRGALAIPKSGEHFSPVRFSFQEKSKETDYSKCSVSYTDPETREVYKGSYSEKEEADPKTLELNARIESSSDAIRLSKSALRKANKDANTGTLELPGHPGLRAGLTLDLTGFGRFDGAWFIETSTHSLGDGYKTSLKIRRTLGY